MTQASIAERLREQRKALGLTQQAAAQLCAIARETWSRYEAGELLPGIEVVAAFARAGADAGFIVTGSRDYEPPATLTPEEQTLLERWRDASRETKNAAMGALLGAGPRSRPPGAQQVFHGQVGQVVKGDSHGPVVQDNRKAYTTPRKPGPKRG